MVGLWLRYEEIVKRNNYAKKKEHLPSNRGCLTGGGMMNPITLVFISCSLHGDFYMMRQAMDRHGPTKIM